MSAIKRVDCILQNMCYYFVFFFFWLTKHQTGMEHEMCDGGRQKFILFCVSPFAQVSHASTALRLLSIAKKMRKYNACSAG